jgi:hypothetical protein
VAFQNSAANASSIIHAIPNGTGSTAGYESNNASGPTNSSRSYVYVTSTEVQFGSGIRGTGTYLPMTFYTGGSERVRIDTSGNVGIGTSSPGANNKLHISSAGTTRLYVENTANSVGVRLQTLSAAGLLQTDTNHPLTFATNNGAEAMRIDTSGNLLVGATSTVDSAKFVVQDAEGNDFAVGRLSGGNRFVGSSSIYNKTTANAANVFVNSSATAYAIVRSTSSIKYKKDVENAVHGLAEVLRLRPVTYRGKEDGEQVFGGLIAEEVHTLGLTEFVQYDENNEPDALAYGPLVSLAFKAIQEQQAIINDLKARLDAANL